VDFLYSLYDALVSINVPSDKARAVVDAMERDMGTTLATKQDLKDFSTREDLLELRQDVELLGQRLEGVRVELGKDIEALQLRLTVRFGGMLMAGFGLMIAAMSAAIAWLRTAGL